MSLWSSKDAVKATSGVSHINWVANGISIDTRTLKMGDLFVALKDQRDGHEYIKIAFEKGAAAALVSRVPDGLNENFKWFSNNWDKVQLSADFPAGMSSAVRK